MIGNNLPSTAQDTSDSTSNYFNNFFTSDLRTSPEVDDAIVGFFEKITGNKDSARTLAASVLFTALSQGISPMEIIDQFRSLESGEVDSYLALFLNLNRVGTSLIGISNSPQTGKYVKRSILP